MKKSYQVLKWTAEVREKELQCLEEVELLDNHDPAVEFESDSESEAYDFLEKEIGGYVEKEDNLAQDGDARVCGNADCLLIGRIGSRFSFTTFFKNKDKGITVSCGCFLGTIAEFRAKVTDTHGNNKHAKIYNLAADMAELQILGEEYFDKLNTNKSELF